jgi:hypothetical protein
LAHLTDQDFPPETASDVTLLFSIFGWIRYLGVHGEYPDYSRIPLRLLRQWPAALMRIYKLLMIAKGAGSVLPISEHAKIDAACREYVRSP